MPTASVELYNTIKSSVRDKLSHSDGTLTQNTKTELILKQLALVFG